MTAYAAISSLIVRSLASLLLSLDSHQAVTELPTADRIFPGQPHIPDQLQIPRSDADSRSGADSRSATDSRSDADSPGRMQIADQAQIPGQMQIPPAGCSIIA